MVHDCLTKDYILFSIDMNCKKKYFFSKHNFIFRFQNKEKNIYFAKRGWIYRLLCHRIYGILISVENDAKRRKKKGFQPNDEKSRPMIVETLKLELSYK